MVLVGRVARTHGIRGHVVVNPETDFVAERFQRGAQVWTRVADASEALTIADARLEGRRPVLAFDGYDSIEAAEALAGAELRVPESTLQPLPEGTYYLHQLVGCRVETVDGAAVGDVSRVDGGAGAAVLAVRRSAGRSAGAAGAGDLRRHRRRGAADSRADAGGAARAERDEGADAKREATRRRTARA